MERGCKGFERWYGGILNNKRLPCEKGRNRKRNHEISESNVEQ